MSRLNELDKEDEHNSDYVASNLNHDHQPTVGFKLLGLREIAEEKKTIHSRRKRALLRLKK